MTPTQKYNKKAAELMPGWEHFLFITSPVPFAEISDHIFNNVGEFYGGMAAVIVELVRREEK